MKTKPRIIYKFMHQNEKLTSKTWGIRGFYILVKKTSKMFALHDESPIVLYSMSLNEGSKLSALHVLITQYITSKCKIIDVIAIFKKF